MTKRKPPSFMRTLEGKRCPVCGEASYSRDGVHPQCSMRQADEERSISIKRVRELLKKEKEAAAPQKVVSRWQKTCPACKIVLHVRKAVCLCGHVFAISTSTQVEKDD